MHVKLLVEIPIHDVAGRPQCGVNFHSALKPDGVVVAQPAPFFVGTIGTEHTCGARHFMRHRESAQPLLTHGAGALALDKRKAGRRPRGFCEA